MTFKKWSPYPGMMPSFFSTSAASSSTIYIWRRRTLWAATTLSSSKCSRSTLKSSSWPPTRRVALSLRARSSCRSWRLFLRAKRGKCLAWTSSDQSSSRPFPKFNYKTYRKISSRTSIGSCSSRPPIQARLAPLRTCSRVATQIRKLSRIKMTRVSSIHYLNKETALKARWILKIPPKKRNNNHSNFSRRYGTHW